VDIEMALAATRGGLGEGQRREARHAGRGGVGPLQGEVERRVVKSAADPNWGPSLRPVAVPAFGPEGTVRGRGCLLPGERALGEPPAQEQDHRDRP
jgi:hypothetical protein